MEEMDAMWVSWSARSLGYRLEGCCIPYLKQVSIWALTCRLEREEKERLEQERIAQEEERKRLKEEERRRALEGDGVVYKGKIHSPLLAL